METIKTRFFMTIYLEFAEKRELFSGESEAGGVRKVQ